MYFQWILWPWLVHRPIWGANKGSMHLGKTSLLWSVQPTFDVTYHNISCIWHESTTIHFRVADAYTSACHEQKTLFPWSWLEEAPPAYHVVTTGSGLTCVLPGYHGVHIFMRDAFFLHFIVLGEFPLLFLSILDPGLPMVLGNNSKS